MNGRKIMVFIFIVSLLFSVYPVKAFCLWGNLKSKIQSELDKNPFLSKEKFKLRVIEENNGYVTIEVYEGDRELRNDIYKDGGIIFNPLFDNNSKMKAVGVLKNTVEFIKTIEGVKVVSLTAAINTPQDQSDDLDNQVRSLLKEKRYEEMITPLKKATELGNVNAARFLAKIYFEGLYGIQKDYKNTFNYLEKVIQKGDPGVFNSMAWYLAVCPNVKYQNGKKALEYAQKAVSQDNTKWYFYGTLAAAYARNGKYKEAVVSQEKATMLLTKTNPKQDDESMLGCKLRLGLYKSGKPYTQE